MKVVCFFPEPTPYRTPLLDAIAASGEVQLDVVYTARTVAARTWDVETRHAARFLRGVRIPGMRRVLRHDYPVTPGVWRLLRRARPDVVVVSGWSTFASQAAILWCRRERVPYLVVVESHDRDRRSGWRRTVKWAVVPRLLDRAAGALVTGTLARDSMLRAGIPPERIRTFANTVDTGAFAARAAELRPRRAELRSELGVDDGTILLVSVSRLVPEKALDILVRAVADVPGVTALLAGSGPEREALELLAVATGAPVIFAGDVAWSRVSEVYAAADVFVLLSRHEPWGVVVNEAAASGLPLLLSEHVGAAADLLRDGENGLLVPVDDVTATAAAIRRLAADPGERRRFGERSAAIAAQWGYEPSVAGFLAAVRGAYRQPR